MPNTESESRCDLSAKKEWAKQIDQKSPMTHGYARCAKRPRRAEIGLSLRLDEKYFRRAQSIRPLSDIADASSIRPQQESNRRGLTKLIAKSFVKVIYTPTTSFSGEHPHPKLRAQWRFPPSYLDVITRDKSGSDLLDAQSQVN